MYSIDTFLFDILFRAGQAIGMSWFFVFLSKYLPYILFIAFCVLLFKQHSVHKKLYVLFAFVLAQIIARGIIGELLRQSLGRPRPFEILSIPALFTHGAGLAFPSGHSIFLFVLAFVAFFLDKRWGWALFGGAAIVGFARVISGVHWPLDIVGGFIVAALGWALVRYLLLPPRSYKKEIWDTKDEE